MEYKAKKANIFNNYEDFKHNKIGIGSRKSLKLV